MKTTSPDPATRFVAASRQRTALILIVLGVLLLVPTVWAGVKAFAAPPAAPAETKDEITGLDKKPEPPADPNRAEHIGEALFGGLAALLLLGGGLYTLFRLPPASEAAEEGLARRTILVIGGGLGGLVMLFGLTLFYFWFESVTKWLSEGDRTQAKWVLIPVVVFVVGAALAFVATQPARAEERTDQGLRRLIYAVNLGLTTILLFSILLIGNVFAGFRLPNRLDTTESGFYTLDPKTREYLAKLDTPVTAYALLPEGGSRAIEDGRRLLIAAQDVNPAMFRVKFLSLTTSRDELVRLKGKYPAADLESFGILLTTGTDEGRSAFIRADDLAKQEGGGFGAPAKITFQGEGVLVRELLFLTDTGGKPVIYFTQGNGELDVVQGFNPEAPRQARRPATQLRAAIEKGYAEIRAWEPEPQNPKVPADCAILVVADPRQTLSKETAAAIKAYMTESKGDKDNKKAGKLIVLAGASTTPGGGGVPETGLEDLLAGFNIRMVNKLILGVPTTQFDFAEMACLINPDLVGQNSLARAFEDKPLVLTGCRPVGVNRAGPGGPIQAEMLLVTYQGRPTWLESDMPTDPSAVIQEFRRDPRLMQVKQLAGRNEVRPIGAVASEGQTNRVLVIGNGQSFGDPTRRGERNGLAIEFFVNAVDWLRDRPAAAAVANKTYGEYVPAKTADVFRLYFLPLGLTALAVIGLGAGVWVVRRK
jgi:hypothetical protein